MSQVNFSDYFIYSHYWICEVKNDKDIQKPKLIKAKNLDHACKIANQQRIHHDSTLEIRNHDGYLFFYKVAQQDWIRLTDLNVIHNSINDRCASVLDMPYISDSHFWIIEYIGKGENDPNFKLINKRLFKVKSNFLNVCQNAERNRLESTSNLRIDTFFGMSLCDKDAGEEWFFSENIDFIEDF